MCALSHKWVLVRTCGQIQENVALTLEKMMQTGITDGDW